MRSPRLLPAAAAILPLLALPLGPGAGMAWLDGGAGSLATALVPLLLGLAFWRRGGAAPGLAYVAAGLLAAAALLSLLGTAGDGTATTGFWLYGLGAWAAVWHGVDRLATASIPQPGLRRCRDLLVPALFGLWLLLVWEALCRGFGIPQVLLPAPSVIGERILLSSSVLWADFRQTFLQAVLIGYALGCGSAFAVAILVDRVPFLQRGLLPMGNLISALPIVGTAPIMVMWFGFDWQSKAAVVVIMTFFPMLVNTVVGLAASGHQERDLLRSYAAGYWQTLFKLRLPMALPFIFNALKINSTLALIGAIVAEFFGTPIVGMGFRISTEVGRMNLDMVWAEIAVAAVAGSAFYGLVALIERGLTSWHPSYRQRT